MTSPITCPQLTNGIATTPTGALRACCISADSENRLLDLNQKPYRVWHNWQEALNSSKIKQWRAEMKQGIWPTICKKCKTAEASRGWSRRLKMLKIAEQQNIALSEVKDDGSIEHAKFVFLDLRLGNLCNLQCQMCNGYSSSKWQMHHTEQFQDSPKPKDSFWQWPNTHIDWISELLKNSQHIRELYFTGGEPLMNSSHWQLLKTLSETPHARNIHIKYNTNATLWQEEWLNIWIKFSQVLFQVSVDGVEEINNWIRWPSDWNQTQKWIENLNHISNSNSKIKWSISGTIQRSNAWSLDQFQNWYQTNYPHTPIHLEFVTVPSQLSLIAWNQKQREEWLKWCDSWANPQFQAYIKEAETHFDNNPPCEDQTLEKKFQAYMNHWQTHTKLPLPKSVK